MTALPVTRMLVTFLNCPRLSRRRGRVCTPVLATNISLNKLRHPERVDIPV